MYCINNEYIDDIKKEFKDTALIRLEYWKWINSLPAHSSIAFWSRSVDHRIICMLAINASLKQLPTELKSSENNMYINYENIRRLCRCTDKTMRTIIHEGVERGDLLKIKEGRESFITGSKNLLESFKTFEKSWIICIKNNI
jgi:hypothetical protein